MSAAAGKALRDGGLIIFNAGSSSLKFTLYDIEDGRPAVRAHGLLEETERTPALHIRDASHQSLYEQRWPVPQAFGALLATLIDWIESHLGAPLRGVGHRVVHGGAAHDQPVRMTPALLGELEALTPLMPLHQPHALAVIRALAELHPELPQIACFDTAFHRSLPRHERLYGLPRALSDSGVQRYGFHGLSYEYIASRLGDYDPRAASGRCVVAHLGNGASLCAMVGGRSVATTMGFSALDGLLMGTRCGALDPGILLYLVRELHYDAPRLEHLLYHESGLLGVSGGLSSDMRSLQASDDPAARDAVDLFIYRIQRELGAMIAAAGGIDALVFTGGIGEHADEVRARVCASLGWLGLQLDADANRRGDTRLHSDGSRVNAWVIATDEDLIIAEHSLALLGAA